MNWLRALAAAGFSVVLPGAGHAILRDWLRALVFAGLYLSAVAIFLPPTDELAAVDSVTETVTVVTTEIDTMGQFVLSFVVLFAAIDATFRALGFPPGSSAATDGDEGPSCPECGKELDEDLAFCHWCTTRLETPEDEAEEEPISS
ncbi:zinc ribbon domain-containing protein [Salinadaptatus halalkaliphilus]|uniref:Zinc ribbon domain-containing protein n=1 Tax=Salinadaptatus halalkaliphilus TaxID=2419781 RepID=A0A4V6RUD2_9EURY|nr:zinc ribbon domain-containing protein [Salinadaptatus halalkaliphilus]THE64857.1 zinc ribbon domain-containing protein [Salinadaptatus halalkaliphilus]